MKKDRLAWQYCETGSANLRQCTDGNTGWLTVISGGTAVKLTEAFALRESLQLSIIFARAME
jgi:hypothetical protein